MSASMTLYKSIEKTTTEVRHKYKCVFRYIILSILLITVGCLVAGIGDLDFDQHAYIMGMLCVFAQGGYLTLVQKSSESKKSTLEMVHINSYNTLPFFIIMSLIFKEPSSISNSEVIHGKLRTRMKKNTDS